MGPLRAESSTTSMPPRERMVAKRRAKAIRKGQPLPRTITNRARKTAKAPVPTLAATRTRRLAALDVAYLDRADGYHIKRVVRRPATPEHAPPVPYLKGQEDIPPSDDESDDGEVSTGTAETVPEAGFSTGPPGANIDVNMDIYVPSDDIDYDAEGETDDEVMEDLPWPSRSPSNCLPNATGEPQPNSVPQLWSDAPGQAHDLIGSASEEDIRVLFHGLDTLPTSFPDDTTTDFPGSFPTSNSIANARDLNGPGSFAMHQLHAAVDNMCRHQSPRQHSHNSNQPSQPPPTSHSFLVPPGQASILNNLLVTEPNISADCPLVGPPHSSGSRTPSPRLATRPTSRVAQPTSHAGTFNSSLDLSHSPARASRAPRSRTRDLVAQARSQARSPSLVIPQPVPILSPDLPAGHLLRRPPLRRSLALPSFLEGGDDDVSSDEEHTRPSTPIALNETDVGLNETSSIRVTQAQTRARRYFNVRVLPRHATQHPPRIPTNVEVQLNALKVYRANRRRNRVRSAVATNSARSRNTLTSGELSTDQRTVVLPMEYHVLKDVVCKNPWPELEERQHYLLDAQLYATGLTGVSSDEVYSQKFLDTVFYKMSANRGNSLAKIEYMVEEQFGVTASDGRMLYQLMHKDLFLYPTADREPSDYFCVNALGAALEVILFKSTKPIGLVFMEELCKPNSPARWHEKLRDRTARRGIPPGLLAFAATQMYWALERMYMGSKVNFDEQHYRGVWDRYFRALIKLPHLGRLRIDMLDRMKDYYMAHWPGAERDDDDDEGFPAW